MKRIKRNTKHGVDHKSNSQLTPRSPRDVQVLATRRAPSDASHVAEHETVDGTHSDDNIKNWIAWKWKWAVAAWKAERLSRQMKELESGSSRNFSGREREYNKANHMGRCINPCIRNVGGFSNAKVPTKTKPRSVPPREPIFEEDERMTLSKMEELQEQVAQMSGCLNKMMPALVFLTKKAGNQKLADDCFRKWKKLPTTSTNMEDHHNDVDSPQHFKLDDCNNSMTISLSPTKNLTIRTVKQHKMQRKPRVADVDPPRPGVEANSTFKSLQTLQTSLRHELQELEGLLASGIGLLQRKKPMSYSAMMSVWEIAESVAQVLSSAKQRLRWCGGGKESHPAAAMERPASPNRHRQPCHPIMTCGGRARARARAAPPPPPRSPAPPSPRTALIEVMGDGGQVTINAAASPRCYGRGGGGRQCTAAEHAALLRRQIQRLQARQRSICVRLDPK